MDKLSSLSFESTIQDLEHGLLIYVILIVDLLKKSFVCLFLPFCLFFGIRQLIDLFINFLQVKVVL